MCEGGVPGRCAIWKEQMPAMMYQKALHRIRPHACLDHRFLYYNLRKQGQNGEFAGLFTGSTIKHLPLEKLAKVQIPIPPLVDQRRIADILSAYDDLIENNRRRIADAESKFIPEGPVDIIERAHPDLGWRYDTIGDYSIPRQLL